MVVMIRAVMMMARIGDDDMVVDDEGLFLFGTRDCARCAYKSYKR